MPSDAELAERYRRIVAGHKVYNRRSYYKKHPIPKRKRKGDSLNDSWLLGRMDEIKGIDA